MSDIIGTLLTTPRHGLARSALPNAPVVEESRRPGTGPRGAIAAALRGLGSASRRLADRIEPVCSRCSAA